MIASKEFVIRARIDDMALTAWIEAGWLLPSGHESAREFSDIDLARALFIRDLSQDMGLNAEGISVTLDLVDQIHGIRHGMRELLDAIRIQPLDTQIAILSAVEKARPPV